MDSFTEYCESVYQIGKTAEAICEEGEEAFWLETVGGWVIVLKQEPGLCFYFKKNTAGAEIYNSGIKVAYIFAEECGDEPERDIQEAIYRATGWLEKSLEDMKEALEE